MSLLLDDKEFNDRYLLSGRMEILSVLNDLIRSRAAVTVYLHGSRNFFLTNLLDARNQTLVFDLSSNEKLNLELAKSKECFCVASHNGIRVRFTVVHPKRFQWDDMDAFRTLIPNKLLRLQRRETHRVALSLTKPVPITVEKRVGTENDVSGKTEQFLIHDLSVEGSGFTVSNETLFRTGDALLISASLSKTTSIKCSAFVRHVTYIGETHAKKNYRVGIAFRNLPGKLQISVQRFLTEIALQRRALTKE